MTEGLEPAQALGTPRARSRRHLNPARAKWMSIAWVGGLIGYSLVRALAVAPVLGPYGVNPWWFLAIDVGSAAPLAIGQLRAIQALRARDAASVQRWVFIVTVSFLAPYIYLLLGAGRALPTEAYYVVCGLVAVLGGATAYRIWQKSRCPPEEDVSAKAREAACVPRRETDRSNA